MKCPHCQKDIGQQGLTDSQKTEVLAWKQRAEKAEAELKAMKQDVEAAHNALNQLNIPGTTVAHERMQLKGRMYHLNELIQKLKRQSQGPGSRF